MLSRFFNSFASSSPLFTTTVTYNSIPSLVLSQHVGGLGVQKITLSVTNTRTGNYLFTPSISNITNMTNTIPSPVSVPVSSGASYNWAITSNPTYTSSGSTTYYIPSASGSASLVSGTEDPGAVNSLTWNVDSGAGYVTCSAGHTMTSAPVYASPWYRYTPVSYTNHMYSAGVKLYTEIYVASSSGDRSQDQIGIYSAAGGAYVTWASNGWYTKSGAWQSQSAPTWGQGSYLGILYNDSNGDVTFYVNGGSPFTVSAGMASSQNTTYIIFWSYSGTVPYTDMYRTTANKLTYAKPSGSSMRDGWMGGGTP